MSSGERLQKVLAAAGVASRRHAETMITGGRVRVNGREVTELGTRVDPSTDRIEVDGVPINVSESKLYFLFHKPRGTVATLSDPEGRATIADYLKEIPGRVYPVGRLDFHTSGALLLTNDGALAQALLHPRRAVPKTYVAKVRGVATDVQLEQLRQGIVLEPVGQEKPGIPTAPADVEVLRHEQVGPGAVHDDGTTWLRITLREGRNRQIHRMAEAVGLFVMRLARIAFAGLATDSLRPGELRQLSAREVEELMKLYLPEALPPVAAQPTKSTARGTPPARRKPEERSASGERRGPSAPRPQGREVRGARPPARPEARSAVGGSRPEKRDGRNSPRR